MTRLVAGAAGGVRLATPGGSSTRPTSERVREALFSRLVHLGAVDGAHVLDLYAGSGALGLEAASRGACAVTLVEHNRRAAHVVRANVETVGRALSGAGRKMHWDIAVEPVHRFLAGTRGGYDLVLSDPPYDLAESDLAEDLLLLTRHGVLTDQATVVVERSVRSPEPLWPQGMMRWDERRYGETVLWFAEPGRVPE
ncbi:Ribosomal RNA small subunit methyltransferase D [Austwickia sp. TVS 96-490-7B]|uniref:16S rRNA (guanine(966)-N(2))-methyltransferase RsmD n=1 Tax=Austwickia sp. TVS 96-490-7B TaxID=2830843 RepID=UPI001C5688F1|nr:16S rRNA (guanine(966)-N(2))-methyltransferase RsmD [Austwickia sp. TVS 96-490-7B]MBW3085793.1 Ribosomal RNA small subunit methyltransferase D [Austwickia sp. TVS 96-490-7B]